MTEILPCLPLATNPAGFRTWLQLQTTLSMLTGAVLITAN
jgi:hypothetical protein